MTIFMGVDVMEDYNYTSPSNALVMLAELKNLGFNDEAFWRVHHFRENSKKERINQFSAYCERKSQFQLGGTNERVHRRLKFVLTEYRELNLPPNQTTVFIDLAEKAFVKIL
jgi:hypothetical protein